MVDHGKIDLLIVVDDDSLRARMVDHFAARGFHVHQASDAVGALDTAERRLFDVAIFDMMLPGGDEIRLLERFAEAHAESEFIVLAARGTVETAVEAMKLGAYDFLVKPFPLDQLEQRIEKAHERGQLRRENARLKALLQRSEPKLEMVGRSPAMREVLRLIERAGPSDKAILIQGESGTGKELVARALHRSSRRGHRPMVVINCAALPEPLLESELFGHEKGAFTGAVSAKPGLFETADGGTIFIDEIGEMPAPLQAKLLRVLEDGSLRRVGSLKERRVDVRLLAATNRDMQRAVQEGRFREDLYYRINVMSLELPPLRERTDDIPLLVEHFLGLGWDIEAEARQLLVGFNWPGNVRQLINAIERAKIMADGHIVRVSDLPGEVIRGPCDAAQRPSGRQTDQLAYLERTKVIEVLRREGGNKTRAAHKLGIDRRKLYRLIEKYGIEDSEFSP